jgi:hypothetical protein
MSGFTVMDGVVAIVEYMAENPNGKYITEIIALEKGIIFTPVDTSSSIYEAERILISEGLIEKYEVENTDKNFNFGLPLLYIRPKRSVKELVRHVYTDRNCPLKKKIELKRKWQNL